jgi:colanic acid/amylovoran biosynthesis glycosyltransferase
MKLAYLLSEYPTLGHTYLLREVRELRSLGWEVQTVSVRKPTATSAPSPTEQEELNSTWYILGSRPMDFLAAHLATSFSHPGRYLRGLMTAWKLGDAHPHRTALATAYFAEAVLAGHRIKKAGIAHVHSHFSSTVALILRSVFDIEVSMTLHGPAEFVDPEGFHIGEKVEASRFVSGISYFGRSQIMQWSHPCYWHKIEVTPLGIEVAGWQPAPFREKPLPFEVISVGRLAAVKGYQHLIEAIALLTQQGRNVRLKLVGDGPERFELEAHASRFGVSDRVVFTGWKNQAELRELYRNSDLCALSSFAEGVPVVLMEAMAAGLPCVAPRITGIPELIRDGVDGLLFTASSTDELASAIAKLMDDTDMRRAMAQSSRARVADKYDLRKNTMHLSEVFRRWYLPDDASPASH